MYVKARLWRWFDQTGATLSYARCDSSALPDPVAVKQMESILVDTVGREAVKRK